jgi:hypothetical protein
VVDTFADGGGPLQILGHGADLRALVGRQRRHVRCRCAAYRGPDPAHRDDSRLAGPLTAERGRRLDLVEVVRREVARAYQEQDQSGPGEFRLDHLPGALAGHHALRAPGPDDTGALEAREVLLQFFAQGVVLRRIGEEDVNRPGHSATLLDAPAAGRHRLDAPQRQPALPPFPSHGDATSSATWAAPAQVRARTGLPALPGAGSAAPRAGRASPSASTQSLDGGCGGALNLRPRDAVDHVFRPN